MIVNAFKHESYSKIPEFIDFKSQLSNSIQKVIANVQVHRIDLLNSSTWSQLLSFIQSFEVESFHWASLDQLYDNRDKSLVPSYVKEEELYLTKLRGKEFPPCSKEPLQLQVWTFVVQHQIQEQKTVIDIPKLEKFLSGQSFVL